MYEISHGDALTVLQDMPDQSVQCCVTSPPYWGLRDYGVDGQLGLEKTPEEYVLKMVEIFEEVRRVLKDNGTLWLNLGDSYAAQRGGTHQPAETLAGGQHGYTSDGNRTNRGRGDIYIPSRNAGAIGLKHKDLVGIPWRVAFALQADGWYLRSDIIWSKPNPMPESVKDRPTKAHEYIFLMSKSAKYYYDQDAIREDFADDGMGIDNPQSGLAKGVWTKGQEQGGRNRRSVWTVSTQPFPGAHFAVFPPKLIEPCILAGCQEGGTVLDPFSGSGTTGLVATKHERNYIGIELNSEYVKMSEDRLYEATRQGTLDFSDNTQEGGRQDEY